MTRLQEIRESKGLTIVKLAELSNVTRQSISRLEKGHVDVANTKTLKALADAMDVQISDFFSP